MWHLEGGEVVFNKGADQLRSTSAPLSLQTYANGRFSHDVAQWQIIHSF